MIRFAGIGCLAAFCVLTGIQYYLKYQRYLGLLLELERFLLHMKSEIQYSRSCMPEFFLEASCREYSFIKEWIQYVADGLNGNFRQSFSQIWKAASTVKMNMLLKNKELFQVFYSLGDEIGGMDMQSQLKYIEIFLRDLEQEICDTKEQLPVRRKLYVSLGIMAGLFLAVILI